MKIHVITLNWNGADLLKKLRGGLFKNLTKLYMENGKIKEGHEAPTWYIRDNGSKDNSIKEIKSWSGIETKAFDVGHNRDSFAKGCNYLIDIANPADDDIILLLNNDIEFIDDESLLKMYNLMEKTNAGVCGCRLLHSRTNKLQHAGVIFSKRYNELPYHHRPGAKSDSNAEKNRYFQVVTAACTFVRASSFKMVGGFDPKLIWMFDDIDLFLSIGQTEKVVYCGETNIYHEESYSLRKNNVNQLFKNSNVRYFKNKWQGKYEMDLEKYLKDPSYNEIK